MMREETEREAKILFPFVPFALKRTNTTLPLDSCVGAWPCLEAGPQGLAGATSLVQTRSQKAGHRFIMAQGAIRKDLKRVARMMTNSDALLGLISVCSYV